MTVHDYLRRHLQAGIGYDDRLLRPAIPSLNDLRTSEWSDNFERLMRNRLIMGAIRYGLLGAPGKKQFDRLEYISRKIEDYRATGNLECLVDIANLSLCEFVEGRHPLRHFDAIGDHDNHAKEIM